MKRAVAVLCLAAALVVAPAAAAGAHVETESTWACVGIKVLDLGLCLGDPLPDGLPPLLQLPL